MPRVEPRAYLRFIVDEWTLVEAIYDATLDRPIPVHTLRRLAAASRTPSVIQRLIDTGVIVQMPDSPSFEIDEFVRDVVAHLKREHALGLAEEIRFYLEHLERHSGQITAALSEGDDEKLRRHALALGNRIKTIQRHLRNNTEAVADIVVRAKTRRRHTPIRQRYGEVLETWESYVEPIREMVDPTGPFEVMFGRLEADLQQALRLLGRRGALVEERHAFEVLLYRLMQLRGELKSHLSLSTERLLPLVREVRRNSIVARGASIALKRARAGGVSSLPVSAWIPINRRVEPTAVSAPEEIEGYLADLDRSPRRPQPFRGVAGAETSRPVHLDPERVREQLRADLPVPDLMAWVIQSCGNAGVDDLLDLFFVLGEGETGVYAVPEGRERYETPTHRIEARRLRVETTGQRGEDHED